MSLSKLGASIWCVLLCCWVGVQSAQAQEIIDWETLSDVEFESRYYKDIDEYLWFPTFGETIVMLEGKKIQIQGHIIPVDLEKGLYVLSAYPYSACFFCGNAGPESVMALKFDGKPRRFELDEIVTFKGILQLNDNNVDEMNYILLHTEEVR